MPTTAGWKVIHMARSESHAQDILSSLEQEGDESAIGTAYASNREAFDAAAAALYKILSAL